MRSRKTTSASTSPATSGDPQRWVMSPFGSSRCSSALAISQVAAKRNHARELGARPPFSTPPSSRRAESGAMSSSRPRATRGRSRLHWPPPRQVDAPSQSVSRTRTRSRRPAPQLVAEARTVIGSVPLDLRCRPGTSRCSRSGGAKDVYQSTHSSLPASGSTTSTGPWTNSPRAPLCDRSSSSEMRAAERREWSSSDDTKPLKTSPA